MNTTENEIRRRNSRRRFSMDNTKLIDISNSNYNSIINSENKTPDLARIAAIDYKLNGGRARSNTGDFVGPRWVVDLEVTDCFNCKVSFNLINRRHHCRYCGLIYCQDCSSNSALLPREFGLPDPQRVCQRCYKELLPQQGILTQNIANHQRVNSIHITTDNCSIRRYINLPYSYSMGSELRKASYSTYNLFNSNLLQDGGFAVKLMAQAKGLAFLTVIKAGFIFAPRLGTGLVVARLPDGRWSAPTAVGTFGVCWGALIGADLTDFVILLNTDEAVQAFSGMGQVSVGVGIDVAVGPVGRSGVAAMNVGDLGIAPALSYSHTRGLFAGVSLEGSVIFCRSDVNHRFYGQPVQPTDLLNGTVAPPRAAQPLYDALYEAVASLPNPHYIQQRVKSKEIEMHAYKVQAAREEENE